MCESCFGCNCDDSAPVLAGKLTLVDGESCSIGHDDDVIWGGPDGSRKAETGQRDRKLRRWTEAGRKAAEVQREIGGQPWEEPRMGGDDEEGIKRWERGCFWEGRGKKRER